MEVNDRKILSLLAQTQLAMYSMCRILDDVPNLRTTLDRLELEGLVTMDVNKFYSATKKAVRRLKEEGGQVARPRDYVAPKGSFRTIESGTWRPGQDDFLRVKSAELKC